MQLIQAASQGEEQELAAETHAHKHTRSPDLG